MAPLYAGSIFLKKLLFPVSLKIDRSLEPQQYRDGAQPLIKCFKNVYVCKACDWPKYEFHNIPNIPQTYYYTYVIGILLYHTMKTHCC